MGSARDKPPPASADASPEELQRRLQAATEFTGDAKAGAAQPIPPAVPLTSVTHQVQAESFPWLKANPKVIKGYSLRVPETMMAKLEFLKNNEPNISVHKLILAGIAKELDARLPKYGWTAGNAEH